jgi:hypothetical protein
MFKIIRSNHPHGFPPNQHYPDPRLGPPYTQPEIDSGWPYGGAGVHDHLCNMAANGSQFWLCRADGGSVYFLLDSAFGYQARQVYDPHGLRTDLSYDSNGHLAQIS